MYFIQPYHRAPAYVALIVCVTVFSMAKGCVYFGDSWDITRYSTRKRSITGVYGQTVL